LTAHGDAPGRRTPLIAANWKMHFVRRDVEVFCRALGGGLGTPGAQVVVFASHPLLPAASWALGAAAPRVQLGGQDLHPEDQGAFTGDVSGPQLRDAGCSFALCGHSERRRDHGESDELVGRKVAAADRAGLVPLLCVGERRDERHKGRTFEVLERQLAAGLAAQPERFAIAYEPVWAIGTGETATPEIAQETHDFLRRRLGALRGQRVADQTRIVYGGSVTPDNAGALWREPDLDGFLVGGASLDVEKFLAIIRVSGSA
jgi:triosephosphate isomerase